MEQFDTHNEIEDIINEWIAHFIWVKLPSCLDLLGDPTTCYQTIARITNLFK